jgi:predicted PhzF superfamily epimerase YddE/YHI9
MIEFCVIDAFTSKPFGGNPACVVYLRDGIALDDRRMLKLAQ